tara:strand:+ start:531 stop:2111 length:1581 start_codon:yes stop_codon:yes gene_type:complete
MANKLLHTKQTKSKVSNHFFASNVGNDSDINIVSLVSKGTYLTAKAGGQWHSVKLQPPQELDNGNFINLKVEGEATFYSSEIQFLNGFSSPGDIYIRAGAKLYFEAKTASPDIYITAGSDTLEFHVGGDNIMTLNETDDGFWLELQNNADLVISAADKIRLDGNESGNTYISGETSGLGDDIVFTAGGGDIMSLTSASVTITGTASMTSTTADQFKIKYDASNYALMNVSATGDLEIETIGAGTTDSDITLNADGDIILNADGGNIDFKDASTTLAQIIKQTSGNEFYLHSAIGTANYLKMYTTSNGVSTISTVDSDGTVGHLTIAPNGILKTEADDGGIFIKETADAGTDTNGYGQIWVHDTNPVELCFTDQDGTDIIGIGKYHYDIKFIGYAGSGTASYLPINGYIFDQTSTSSRNEYHSFIAPYNGTIQKVAFRSEVAQDGDLSFRVLESADGTEIPGTTVFRHETTVDIADDVYQELDMTGPGTGSDYSPLTKGRIYVFYLSCPSAPLDTNITIVFKWDITS